MKRLDSSDSLGGLISICHSAEENVMGAKNNHHVYSRGFQSMLDGLDEEDCAEESGHLTEKKRRLNVDQVKALEKNFEVENKLEPERKVKLAQELGLQPRQVAIWFQNRRARWKTKQLERDYGVLKANYDALKRSFDSVQQDKDSLLAEIKELKSKLQEDSSTETKTEIKEEIMVTESDNIVVDQSKTSASVLGESESTDMNHDSYNSKNGVINGTSSLYRDLKDGSSDSDSSAILNEDNSSPNNAAISSSGVVQHQQQQQQFMMMSPSLRLNCSSSSSDSPTSLGCFQFSDSKMISTNNNTQKPCHQQQYQFVRMEEHNFFGAEEPCNFYSEDQAPTLHWYYPDQWN